MNTPKKFYRYDQNYRLKVYCLSAYAKAEKSGEMWKLVGYSYWQVQFAFGTKKEAKTEAVKRLKQEIKSCRELIKEIRS